MPHFSAASLAKLATCHHKLQKLARAVIEDIDIVVICGHRTKVEQDKAFETGHSKLQFPESRHNSYPSEAIDIGPIVNSLIPWDDHQIWDKLRDIVFAKAKELGIEVEWGGLFPHLVDRPHWQLGAVAKPDTRQLPSTKKQPPTSSWKLLLTS